MSGFSAQWLALREPFDAAARAHELVDSLRRRLSPHTGAPLEVVDLGAGAGSNLRYLAPQLAGAQNWRLVDHDAVLLDAALARTEAWAQTLPARAQRHGHALELHAERLDLRIETLNRSLAPASALRTLPIPAGALVSAAALLDLVSAEWLDALIEHVGPSAQALLFALTYDGRTTCTPPEPEDSELLELFNRHQRHDKGFGPALGPQAAAAAAEKLAAAGYRLRTATSDWRIGSAEPEMQTALLDGWLAAALEIAPARARKLRDWHARRSAHVAAGRSAIAVGHVDLVAWRGDP
jgi:hypothetical protein